MTKLKAIAFQIQLWIDWSEKERAKEGLKTEDDTHIMVLPVPTWPSVGQMKEWIKELEAADARDQERQSNDDDRDLNEIWKFDIPPSGNVKMPKGAKILSVGLQDNFLKIWAAVNSKSPDVSRTFVVVGTGMGGLGINEKFIGTVQTGDGYVWHVFDHGEQSE